MPAHFASEIESALTALVAPPAAAGSPGKPGVSRVGRFLVRHRLSRSRSADVLLARDLDLDRLVVLKIAIDPPADPRNTMAVDPAGNGRDGGEASARLKALIIEEGRLLADLDGVPGVVRVHELGFWERRPFLVLERLRGMTLEDAARERPPSSDEAAATVAKVARVVDALHRRLITHQDIKPENIMVAPDGSATLIDFGLARRVDVREGAALTDDRIAGSLPYMAPEQAWGEARSRMRSDIFGLGAVLYRFLSGVPPYGDNCDCDQFELLQRVRCGAVDTAPLATAAPPALASICRRALAVDPDARPATAGELADELEAFLASRAPAGGGGGNGTGALGCLECRWNGRNRHGR